MAKSYTQKQIIEAIEAAEGNVTQAAKLLGCATSTIWRRAGKQSKSKDGTVRENRIQVAIDEARRVYESDLVDLAREGLMAALDKRESWAIRYVLSAKGGFSEQTRVDHTTNGKALQVAVVYGSDDSADYA
jgi:hypothetical protein